MPHSATKAQKAAHASQVKKAQQKPPKALLYGKG